MGRASRELRSRAVHCRRRATDPPPAQRVACRVPERFSSEVQGGLPDGPGFALPSLAVAASRATATEPRRPHNPLQGPLVADPRGAVTAEYVILLGVVGVVAAAAIAGLGPPMVEDYARTRAIILAPFP